MTCEAVVVAAGTGERFGGAVPKQFHLLAGRPIVVRSCLALLDTPGVDGIVLVLPGDAVKSPPAWAGGLDGAIRIVAGGPTRTGSVRRGVAEVDPAADVILVHDGVRPLVTRETVRRVLRAAAEGPAVPAVPVADTVKRVDDDGRVLETVDRGPLRLAQTPQGFPAGVLRDVLARAAEEGAPATDEAGLCERYGADVRTVPGERENLKITRKEDLRLAELLLQRRGGPEAGSGDPGA